MRASREHSLLALVAVLIATPIRPARAQLGCAGATCTVEISMPVSDVLRISLSSFSVSLGTPGEAEFIAGYGDVTGTAVNVSAKSNRAFTVQLSGVTPTFSYSGSLPNPSKSASDLLWATSASALSTTTSHLGATTTLLSQGAGSITTPLFFRTLWSFVNDVPGTYSLAIRFTLSAP